MQHVVPETVPFRKRKKFIKKKFYLRVTLPFSKISTEFDYKN